MAETIELLAPIAACCFQEEAVVLTEISRHAGTQLSYNDFYWKYMNNNLPVLLTGISEKWECRLNWTKRACNTVDNHRAYSSIDFIYLKSMVDNCMVPVADCSKEYFNSHTKIEMLFHDFLDHWQTKIEQCQSNIEQCQSNVEGSHQNSNTITKNLYLKDWHLKSQMPNYDFYQVPQHFSSDWLNEQLVNSGRDDYRFVYMGPKDSWTPFHSDVFGSYSWSTNIAGCKKWILLPPGEELKLVDNLGNLPFSIDEALLKQKQVHFYTLLQSENEALFVPSGWYHQVWNLTDTISINHNWFNACNVQRVWCNLATNMQQVIAEIEDCRQMDNFDEHCQTMLRASFGINYLDFLELLEFIAERRLACCCDNGNNTATGKMSSKCLPFDKFTLNDYHIRHDLQNIRIVIELMLQDAVVNDSRAILYRRCLQLLERTKVF